MKLIKKMTNTRDRKKQEKEAKHLTLATIVGVAIGAIAAFIMVPKYDNISKSLEKMKGRVTDSVETGMDKIEDLLVEGKTKVTRIMNENEDKVEGVVEDVIDNLENSVENIEDNLGI